MSDSFSIQSIVHDWRLPGLVACFFDRQRVETFAFGERDPAVGLPMTPETVFPIASVTKTFTSDLLLRAVSAGKINLQKPLRDQLPGFTLSDPEATRRLTPLDAAAHFSGLPPHTWAWVFGDTSREEFIRKRLPHLGSVGPFREKHRYSNILYAVLGQSIETATGESWEKALQRQILTPLNLQHTTVMGADWAEGSTDPARPHRDGVDGPVPISPFVALDGHPIAPASEMMASMPDLARWGQFQLQLDPQDLRWQPQSRIREGLDYGLGWRLDRVGDRRRVWHSGQCSGYAALLVLFPDEGRGYALAANRSGSLAALHAVVEWLDQGRAANMNVPPPPPEIPALKPLPPAPATALAEGVYRNPGYGTVRVQRDGGHLTLQFQNSAPSPVQGGVNGLRFTLPVYGVDFPVVPQGNALEIPFESAVPPIRFDPEN